MRWGRALFSLFNFFVKAMFSKHAQLSPFVAPPTCSAIRQDADARPGCPADPIPNPCVPPCRILGADAIPRCPCRAHLLAFGAEGFGCGQTGNLKSLFHSHRNKTSIEHFALSRPVLSLHGHDFTSAVRHSCEVSREVILLMTLPASPQKPLVWSKHRGFTQESDAL